jgi:alpha-L-fucosidase 2
MKTLLILFVGMLALSYPAKSNPEKRNSHNLVFQKLAGSWDEAIPLGNGMVGSLVWQKGDKLRFSLDRADLWDLRPMANIDFNKWKFKDIYQHWKDDQYLEVQKAFDEPYDRLPAPSKIPAGALEFEIKSLGKVKSISLDVEKALCTVLWENGTKLTTFVHAEQPVGWYKFENLFAPVIVSLVPPAYNRAGDRKQVDQSMSDLDQLGYPQGEIVREKNRITYDQKGWGEFSYQISTQFETGNKSQTGCWSISSANKGWPIAPKAESLVGEAMKNGIENSIKTHNAWWSKFWSQSAVEIPDTVLEKQYYLEMYKFGSAARADAPPISLQAVWTADNGKLPPWKGDFHHDLNTQLSYWPSYAGNQLNLEEGFLNWLWKLRPTFKKYTRDYFGTGGMNVPGVSTLEGEPMGGWIQYSFGQSVGAWLSQHFYLHWKFSMDRTFLKEKAYPWIKDVAIFLDEIADKSVPGKRKLIMSSSPEIYNNSRKAWFAETTNFDLALIRWTYEKSAEMADELGLPQEAKTWRQILSEWPELAVDSNSGFLFAPGFPFNESHRHFSHLMAFHPLGTIDFSNGEKDQEIIKHTLENLVKTTPDYWCGYSYSWLGNLYARAMDGEKAAETLRIFSENFCLPNSFHVNGEQHNKGYSKMKYRPFTLEGNFAFASGIQEMLLQSHTGVIKVFPAIPASWTNAKFENLRAQGAFLISAEKENGRVTKVHLFSEKGGNLRLENPFGATIKSDVEYRKEGNILLFDLKPGKHVNLKL